MKKAQLEQKEFLEQQIQWSKNQVAILDKIDSRLHEMRAIAEYARDHKLDKGEADRLNRQLNELKNEIYSLEEQMKSVFREQYII
ncbi:hypothetical protein ACFO3D_05060 [Virgibacillus kekensis]|uniref:Uncharacterized protein n=1 Tax=Virgibacillus kekensis TaxID=202261 RepID=A0ABV9DFV3_9BACI